MNPALAAQAENRRIAVSRAAALRWWRAGYEVGRQAAEHEHQALAQWDRLAASFHAQRSADQQVKVDALLLEAIAAFAALFSGPDHPGNRAACPPPPAKDHRQDLPERLHRTLPTHVQTANR